MKNKKIFLQWILILIPFLIASCSGRPDLESERNELLKLHHLQQEAHFQENAKLLVDQFSGNFISINHGEVHKPTKAESIRRFTNYFEAVEFKSWEDLYPPSFTFSDDATLATSIVEKIVIIKDKRNSNQIDTTYFSWMAVYKKYNGKWFLEQMVSTNK